jgi:hypothetical protein
MARACSFRIHSALAIVLVALGVCAHPALAGYTYTRIATTDGFLDSFNPPAINNQGSLAFFAWRDAGGQGIYRADGTSLTTIAETADPGFYSLTGCGSFQLVNDPDISDAGAVAFRAYTFDPDTWNCVEAIYLGGGGPPTPITQADPGDGVYSDWCNPTISASGLVALRAVTMPDYERGLYQSGGGPATLVLPTTPTLYDLSDPDVNGEGRMVFHGGGPGSWGIYLSEGSSAVCIARENADYYTTDVQPVIADSGQVAFHARTSEWVEAICLREDTVRVLCDSEGPFESFGAPAINSSGEVVFFATLDDWSRGIFHGPDPALDKVIASGDSLFGSTVSQVECSRHCLNESGAIAFSYSLSNGETGVALASPQATNGVAPLASRQPARTLLLPVSPNPAPGAVKLTWRSAVEEPGLTLAVYAPSGRLVRHLTAGPGPAGEHRVVWDGREESGQTASSGVYWARLETGGATQAVRFVLIR